jgi:hypothetical protein
MVANGVVADGSSAPAARDRERPIRFYCAGCGLSIAKHPAVSAGDRAPAASVADLKSA